MSRSRSCEQNLCKIHLKLKYDQVDGWGVVGMSKFEVNSCQQKVGTKIAKFVNKTFEHELLLRG